MPFHASLLKGHKKEVLSVASGPENLILSASEDNSLRLWDVRTHRSVRWFSDESVSDLASCCFAGDNVIFAADGRRVVKFDLRSDDAVLVRQFTGASQSFDDDVNVLCANSNRVFVPCDDGVVYVLDATKGDLPVQRTLKKHSDICSVALLRQPTELITGGYDYLLCLWDTTGKLRTKLDVRKALATPDASQPMWNPPFITSLTQVKEHIITGLGDGSLIAFDDSWKLNRAWIRNQAHNHSVAALCAVKERVMSAGTDRKLCIWEVGSSDKEPFDACMWEEKPNDIAPVAGHDAVALADTSCNVALFSFRS